MFVEEYSLNDETLQKIVVICGKQAKVKDHISDALTEKFKDHLEILKNLFVVRIVDTSLRGPKDVDGRGRD